MEHISKYHLEHFILSPFWEHYPERISERISKHIMEHYFLQNTLWNAYQNTLWNAYQNTSWNAKKNTLRNALQITFGTASDVLRWSPSQVLTAFDVAWLRWLDEKRYFQDGTVKNAVVYIRFKLGIVDCRIPTLICFQNHNGRNRHALGFNFIKNNSFDITIFVTQPTKYEQALL